MKIILFSTNCPQCKVLEAKLKEKGITFELIDGERAIEYIQERGFMSAPLLSIDGENMPFGKAIKWVNEYGN